MSIVRYQTWLLAFAVAFTAFTGGVSVALAQPKPAASKFYEQGIMAFNKGNPTLAIQYFEQAVRADGDFADAWFNLGSVHYRASDYPKAYAAFERVVAINPNDYQARYNVGLTLEKMGRLQDALTQFQGIPPQSNKFGEAQEKVAALGKQLNPTVASKPAGQSPSTASNTAAAVKNETNKDETKTAKKFVWSLAGPTGMALGPQGEIYVANYSKNNIMRVDSKGQKQILVEGKGLNGPIGLVRDPRTGDFYVANYTSGDVMRVSPKGETFKLTDNLKKPYSLLLDSLANVLYVTEQGSNTVSQIQL